MEEINVVENKDKPPLITVTRNEDGTFKFSGRSFDIVKDKNLALKDYGYMLRCYGIRLMILPTDEQRVQINKTIGCFRVVYNDYLATRKKVYDETKKGLSPNEYKKKYLPVLKAERPYLAEVDQHALGYAPKHVDSAYKNFFAGRAKFPRFASCKKPSGNHYETSISKKTGFFEKDGKAYVNLTKVGDIEAILPSKKFCELFPLGADLTGVTVSRESNAYYVSLHVALPVPIPSNVQTVSQSRVCAVDMGLKSFAIGKVGDEPIEVENPRWITHQAKRIRRLHRSLSRKKHGSKNWEKARLKLAKAQRKIANQRKDHHHKLSRKLANRCDVFICEDLNIKGMVKNHKLAREISSAGWGNFLSMVKYKMEWKEGIFLKVDPFFPSSKLCHVCGYKYTELSLKERQWECPICHTVHDRDGNAAMNLFSEGLRILKDRGIEIVA